MKKKIILPVSLIFIIFFIFVYLKIINTEKKNTPIIDKKDKIVTEEKEQNRETNTIRKRKSISRKEFAPNNTQTKRKASLDKEPSSIDTEKEVLIAYENPSAEEIQKDIESDPLILISNQYWYQSPDFSFPSIPIHWAEKCDPRLKEMIGDNLNQWLSDQKISITKQFFKEDLIDQIQKKWQIIELSQLWKQDAFFYQIRMSTFHHSPSDQYTLSFFRAKNKTMNTGVEQLKIPNYRDQELIVFGKAKKVIQEIFEEAKKDTNTQVGASFVTATSKLKIPFLEKIIIHQTIEFINSYPLAYYLEPSIVNCELRNPLRSECSCPIK